MDFSNQPNSADKNDTELIEAVKNGSQEAFEEIVSRYRQRLYQTAYAILSSHHDAEEVTQDALVKAYRALPNFRGYHTANDNVSHRAVYRCTPEADAPAEKGTVKLKPGKLFDRRRAYAQGNADNRKYTLCDRVAGWTTSGPITIEIDLKKTISLNRVELFYTGSLRDVTVSVSSNGKKYTQVGFFPAGKNSFLKYGIRKKTLQLSESAHKGAKIKLEFAASDNPGAIEKGAVPQLFAKPLLLKLPWQKANFMLAEIELWSAE